MQDHAPGARGRKCPTKRRAKGDAAQHAPLPAMEAAASATAEKAALEYIRTGSPAGYPVKFMSVRDYAEKTGRLVRADDEWVRMLHGDGERPDIRQIRNKLSRMIGSPLQAESGAQSTCASLLREMHVKVAHSGYRVSSDVKMSFFPGPMARPLTRRLGGSVAGCRKYWITEKSDGVRAMLYTKLVADFACWYVHTENGWKLVSLNDVLLLEMTAQALVAAKKDRSGNMSTVISSALRGGQDILTMRVAFPEAGAPCDAGAADAGKMATLDTCGYRLENKDGESVPLRRSAGEGYGFAYFLDRSCDVFLMLEELTVPGHSALLDGELIFNRLSQRVEYLVYDVPLVTRHLGPKRSVDALFGTAPMSERIRQMQTLCELRMANHRTRAKAGSIVAEEYLRMRTKEFYPSDRVQDVLDRIVRDETGEYVYNRENLNDGLVFSPDSGADFAFRPGTSMLLLKYKFPSTLTVDWRIVTDGRLDEAGRRRFAMYYNVKDKTTKGEWYEEPAFFKKTILKVKKGLHKLEENTSYIAECDFDVRSGLWRVLSIRQDKVAPNSYLTAASVLEAVCEDMRPANVVNLCLRGDDLKGPPSPTLEAHSDDEAVAATATPSPVANNSHLFTSPFCTFQVRTHKDPLSSDPNARRLTLQVRVKTSEHKHPRSFSYIQADEVFGFGCEAPAVDRSSQLPHLLYIEVANRGGCMHWSDCCVRAVYRPAVGRWEIFQVVPRSEGTAAKNGSTINTVVRHLEQTCQHGPSTYKEENEAEKRFADSVCSVRDTIVDSDAHYARKSLDTDLDEGRSQLRSFHNFVKTVTVLEAAEMGAPGHSASRRTLSVLDLCCGRGGDLIKWGQLAPRSYVGVDSCLEAVGTAARRYSDAFTSLNSKSRAGVPSFFDVGDAFDPAMLSQCVNRLATLEKLPNRPGVEPSDGHVLMGRRPKFSCISCQFALHYAFSSRARAEEMVRGIAEALEEGGIFFGTIVNSNELLARLEAAQEKDPSARSIGNGVYEVTCGDTFPAVAELRKAGEDVAQRDRLYGVSYDFSFEECVEKETEHVIFWDELLQLCASRNLVPVTRLCLPFLSVYEQFASKHDGPWQRRMGKPASSSSSCSAAKRRRAGMGRFGVTHTRAHTHTHPPQTPTLRPPVPRRPELCPWRQGPCRPSTSLCLRVWTQTTTVRQTRRRCLRT